ncbi:MAG: hypothetical protein IIC55_07950 [Proteobacteria bacterium]|nr:hypothetical protein [Pseudomonadota bacterium]
MAKQAQALEAEEEETPEPEAALEPAQKQPTAGVNSVFAISENGAGFKLHGHTTHSSLEAVMAPGYFLHAGKHGLQRNDHILLVCEADSDTPCYATVVVKALVVGQPAEVLLLGKATVAENAPSDPFSILDLPKNATAVEVETAHMTLKMERDPQYGGTASAMKRLNDARDLALKICNARSA